MICFRLLNEERLCPFFINTILPTFWMLTCTHAAIYQFAVLWFSLVEDMLNVKAKKPQRSHPVNCGDVAGWVRGVPNLPSKWHVLIASCEAQNIPMTLSSFYSSLHSSLFHFCPSSAWYFSFLFRPPSSWKNHKSIHRNSQTRRVAYFSLNEVKIPQEAITESIITRYTFTGVVKYFVPWLTVCWSQCLYEYVNMKWFSSSVKAQIHTVWLILAGSAL